MKKVIFILVSLLMLTSCSTINKLTSKGDEIETKLKKIHLKERYHPIDDGNGKILFTIQTKDERVLFLLFGYSDGEVGNININELEDAKYIHYTLDNTSCVVYYDSSTDKECVIPADGGTLDKPTCQGEALTKAKQAKEHLYTRPLKEAGITKEDLVTFGNYYYKQHKNAFELKNKKKE